MSCVIDFAALFVLSYASLSLLKSRSRSGLLVSVSTLLAFLILTAITHLSLFCLPDLLFVLLLFVLSMCTGLCLLVPFAQHSLTPVLSVLWLCCCCCGTHLLAICPVCLTSVMLSAGLCSHSSLLVLFRTVVLFWNLFSRSLTTLAIFLLL